MKKLKCLLLLFALLFVETTVWSQVYSSAEYEEPDDGSVADIEEWEALEKRLYVSWASKDIHYEKRVVPSIKIKNDTVVYVWRGERASVEALLFSPVTTEKLNLRMTAWNGDSAVVDASHGKASFVNYVLTDDFKACGAHPTNLAPYLVPDVIDIAESKAVEACTTRPVWCTLDVPHDIPVGEYSLALEISNAETQTVVGTLNLRVNVQEGVLPLPSEQEFQLNLWQQPYSVSRYYGLDNWSKDHFDAMRPYMQMLARAGQKVVTAILFYEPWGEQSNDKFEPMIETVKKVDGSWSYDYTVFDKWVEFMEECGIHEQINCFSMVPWDMNFRYIDEKSGEYAYLATTTSSAAYRELWTSFLKDFAEHLRSKGWFEKTCIAMDERALGDMMNAYNIAQSAVPGIKMALAGNYHTELADKLYDYCVALGQEFTDEEMAWRNEQGYVTTAYTSCADVRPNIFSNSEPAEAAYLPVYCAANGFNGYLHWSWINWTDDPLHDSRFRLFAPGDTYCMYPDGRSSVRFERLAEGIQAYEKIRLLRQKYKADNDLDALAVLENELAKFKSGMFVFPNTPSRLVNVMNSILNNAPMPPMEDVTDYCEIVVAEDKKDIAVEKRWLKSVKTLNCLMNLNYSASSPSENGYVKVDTFIQVEKGRTFKLRAVPTTNDDDIRYCRAALFADWNGDSIFDISTDEQIAIVGNANTGNNSLLSYTFTVNVPEDAADGMSLLRLCYADAWKEEPVPCGELYKGFAMDIPMEIVPVGGTGIGAPKVAYSWSAGVLTLNRMSSVAVYGMDGVLLDVAIGVTSYSMYMFLGGKYIINVVAPGCERIVFKYSKK